VRATNWVGDAVMSLPALRALRHRFAGAHIAILAKPWVADLYRREPICDELIPYTAQGAAAKFRAARELRPRGFDCAILLQNAFEAAAIAYLAGIPERIGYARDGRSLLLTRAVEVPRPGEIPRHQRFYYLELLRRAGILDHLPETDVIRLECAEIARASGVTRFRQLGFDGAVVGVSPGAAYGSAKRWLPERFAEAATRVAQELGASVAIFGSKDERELCDAVASAITVPVQNLAGVTTLA
jgi:heptosyltransferase II